MVNMISLPAAAQDPPPLVLLASTPFSLAEPASRTQTFSEEYFFIFQEERTISPETSNKNCADSHEEDHHQRHVEALLLIRRAGDRFNHCWQPDKLTPVHIEVAVRRAGLELKDPRFRIFLHKCDYLQWVASVKFIRTCKEWEMEPDRNGDVEVWGIVRPAHYSVCYQTNRLDKEHDNLDERLFTKHLPSLKNKRWGNQGSPYSSQKYLLSRSSTQKSLDFLWGLSEKKSIVSP